ncbi:MAG: hypothetical protein JSS61_03885 [Verrucomicrobia bacterium]|nr:hypothetical protein [Verrucomicrobiota bacterium]
MKRLLSLTIILFVCQSAAASEAPPLMDKMEPSWKGRVRVHALHNFDQFLGWSTSEALKSYQLIEPLQGDFLEVDIPLYQTFADRYGYFSSDHPLVGRVSAEKRDLEIVCCILKLLYDQVDDPTYLEFATAEVLAKALAYRELVKGLEFDIPVILEGKASLERFQVDKVFNLWRGMPAFGLLPDREGVPAILLFRGTDFSIHSQRGWASLMSDLDLAGPGLTTFQHAQAELHEWLLDVAEEERAARVLGFSLGGALAAYTYIYENLWLADAGSMAFNAPGVSREVTDAWGRLPADRRVGFTSYVYEGDIVSKVGKLFGSAIALSTEQELLPLRAHTILMSAQSRFYSERVDVPEENDAR